MTTTPSNPTNGPTTDTDSTTGSRTTRRLAQTYFAAWQAGDAEALRRILADDATFQGPLGTASSAEECVAGLIGMRRIMDKVEIRAMVADGDDVVTFFDLHTSVAAPAPTANWTHVENGLIRSIRVTFDPRGILAAG